MALVATTLVLPHALATHDEGATLTLRQEAREGEECRVLFVEVDDASNETIRLGIFQDLGGSAPDRELVEDEPTGTFDEESGLWDFALGPYDQEDLDHAREDLYVGVAWGEPGEHRILSEHFDIQCEPPVGPPSPTQPPVCTDTLRAEALDDGSVRLLWDPVVANEDELDFYRVWRIESGEGTPGVDRGEAIAEVQGTTFLDETTEGGVGYRYSVDAVGETFTSCGTVVVVAVPFFGAPALAALAGVGAVGAYVAMRRRA